MKMNRERVLVCLCCARLPDDLTTAAAAVSVLAYTPRKAHLVAWRVRREERQRCRHRRSRASTFAPQAQEDTGHPPHRAQPGSPGKTTPRV